MPVRMNIGLAPEVTFLRPAPIIACPRTIEVVVPSPAMSLVLVAISLKSWAPMFSKGSSSSISRAMVTPSLVMVGEPNFLSRSTLRPLGPSVTLAASATASTPLFSLRRASSSNSSCLGIYANPPREFQSVVELGQDVLLTQDQIVLALVLELGTGILGEDDGVTLLHVHGRALSVLPLSWTTGENGALLRLLLGGLGDEDARRRGLLLLRGLDHHPAAQRLDIDFGQRLRQRLSSSVKDQVPRPC